MDYETFLVLVKLMKSIWTYDDFLGDKDSLAVWYRLLKDIPADQAAAAVECYAMTNSKKPTPADIRAMVVDMQSDKTDWGDGWEEVLKAIRRYGMYNETEALESLSPMTREVVKRLGWKQICQSEQDEMMAIRANFRMMFEQKHEGERKNAVLSVDLKERIEQITSKDTKQIGGSI